MEIFQDQKKFCNGDEVTYSDEYMRHFVHQSIGEGTVEASSQIVKPSQAETFISVLEEEFNSETDLFNKNLDCYFVKCSI